jgi:hypothetical protein
MADPSIIRQKIRQTLDKRFYLERKILGITSPLAGASLVRYRIRCGKKGCSCQRGPGHGPYTYLSAKVNGKTRLKLIPKEIAWRVERIVAQYREYQKNLRLIRCYNREVEDLFKRLRNILVASSPYKFK